VRDIPGLRILGPEGLQARAPVISFDIAGLHPHDICTILDAHGVALRGGHHCAQPLMECFDLAGTTRASLQVYNDEGDVEALLSGLDDARARLA
jgi:cysteine desulfurase/selenocysteine lyase